MRDARAGERVGCCILLVYNVLNLHSMGCDFAKLDAMR